MKILITGASRGIGFFLIKELIYKGFNAYGAYSNTLPKEFTDRFDKVDVTNTQQVYEWVNRRTTETDEIVLINCAGINYNSTARRADVDDWAKVIDVNLVGTFRAINAVLPLMYNKAFGRIINFSSIVGQKGVPGTSAYAASKTALWGMTKAISVENAHKNITINNINLGYINAGMTMNDVPETLRETLLENIPMKRFGDLDSVLNTVLYFINTEYVTGTSIDLNGGLY